MPPKDQKMCSCSTEELTTLVHSLKDLILDTKNDINSNVTKQLNRIDQRLNKIENAVTDNTDAITSNKFLIDSNSDKIKFLEEQLGKVQEVR